MGRVTFDTVRRLALAMPGVEETTSYGTASFKLKGHLLACRAINKSAEPDTLAICVPAAERDDMMAAEPDLYYVTDRYVDYDCGLRATGYWLLAIGRRLQDSGFWFSRSPTPETRSPKPEAVAGNGNR